MEKKYNSIEELREDAFACYQQEGLNNTNAIITHFDIHKQLVLLTEVPGILKNGDKKHLYIKSVSNIFS